MKVFGSENVTVLMEAAAFEETEQFLIPLPIVHKKRLSSVAVLLYKWHTPG